MNQISSSLTLLSFILAAGCAAEPAERVRLDGPEAKREALVGDPCVDSRGCGHGEYCDLRLCIPERPCPTEGICRNITRFYDNEGQEIPDNDSSGIERSIIVDRPAANIARAHVYVGIEHTWRGDLEVALTSPAGTRHVLHNRTGGGADNLDVNSDVTEIFEGEPAVGAWILSVADHAARDTGRVLTWRIELDYAPEVPDPGEGNRVWANVDIPLETPHPYANDQRIELDLRPYSGGAQRARIRFARIDVERGYDVVEVFNYDTGEVLDRMTGSYGAFTSREYETGNLGVRLVSDFSIVDWGVALEGVDTFGLGCLEDNDCGPGWECPNETIRCIRFPCFVSCQPERGGEVGSACRVNEDCASGLYCGSDQICRAGGTCADVEDCTVPGNAWIHIECAGYPTCDSGMCNWHCGPAPVCTDGETRFDGCNTCTCSGGLWACTRRACPPVAQIGEACPAGTICAGDAVCDRGRTTGPTCGDDHIGVCESGPEVRLCPTDGPPVCACTGQTFQNDCLRIGRAPFAYDGECRFDVAIPDANVDGIESSIEVRSDSPIHRATVTVRIDHTYRGDLVVWVEAPDGSAHPISVRQGGSADDLEWSGTIDLGTVSAAGTWTLHVSDRASWDTGVLRFFNVQP